jgi:membrane protein YqaA with SNARE-associated domain
VLFSECGLLIGFAFPGDTLLFSVGLLASQGFIPEPFGLILLVLTAAAILGNIVGYEIGRWAGPPCSSVRAAPTSAAGTSSAPVCSSTAKAHRRSCWRGSSRSCGPSSP